MNKERRATLTVLTEVLQAAHRDGALSRRMSRAVENGVAAVLSSEERALRAMEPYKDDNGTAQNYRNTTASITHLKGAQDALVEEDVSLALDHLEGAADPQSRQVHREPPKKRLVKK